MPDSVKFVSNPLRQIIWEFLMHPEIWIRTTVWIEPLTFKIGILMALSPEPVMLLSISLQEMSAGGQWLWSVPTRGPSDAHSSPILAGSTLWPRASFRSIFRPSLLVNLG